MAGALYTALALGEMTKGGIRMAGVWEGFDSGPCVSTSSNPPENWYTPSLFEAIAGGTNPACPSIVQPPIGTAFPRASAINVVQHAFNAGDTVFAPSVSATDSLSAVRVYGARRGSGYGLLLVNTGSEWVATAVILGNDSRKFTAISLSYGWAQYISSVNNDWPGPVSQSLGTVSGSFMLQVSPSSITAITLSATP